MQGTRLWCTLAGPMLCAATCAACPTLCVLAPLPQERKLAELERYKQRAEETCRRLEGDIQAIKQQKAGGGGPGRRGGGAEARR